MTPEQSITREFAARELVIFILVVLGFVLLGTILSAGIAPLLGIEDLPKFLENISEETPPETLQGVQVILAISQLFTFLIPGLVFAFFYDKFKWLTARPPSPKGEHTPLDTWADSPSGLGGEKSKDSPSGLGGEKSKDSPLGLGGEKSKDSPLGAGGERSIFSPKRNWKERILLHRLPSGDNLSWGLGLLMLTFIAMQLVYWLNKQIPLPESLRAAEDSSQALIQAMMQLDSPYALITNLFIMALLPAIGEELIFRGLLQRIAVRLTANVHAGIWISATLFSLMHWQFEGFFVRQLLGALFGYLLYWSGSLWLPIIVHFIFNALQIIAQYAYFQGAIDLDIDQELELTTSNLLMGAVALVLTLILCNYVHRKRQAERLEYERAMGENL